MTDSDEGRSQLVSALERIAPGDHLCLIYETREEQFATVVPFMRLGLERGERCIYIADESTAMTMLNAMRAEGIDVDAATESGALSVLTKQDTYLRQGYFGPDGMIHLLREVTDSAKAAGFSALRATGEVTWALAGDPGAERLIEYEAKLNHFFAAKRALAICQYDRNRFSPEVIRDVIRTHPWVIVGGMVCWNFYHAPPEEVLKPRQAHLEVERLLTSILGRERNEQSLLNALDALEATGRELRLEVVERRLAEEALRQHVQRLRILREIDQAILAARSPEAIAQAAVGHIRHVVPCRRASVAVYDFEASIGTVIAVDAEGETQAGVEVRVPLEVFGNLEQLRKGKTHTVEDVLLLSRPHPILRTLLAEGVRAFINVPLIAHGELIGSLNLGADHSGALAPEHVEIAREVADSLAVAIHNARLFDEVRAGRDRLQALSRQLVEVQEIERRHIARELHDEIGQALTALKLTLDMSARAAGGAVGARLDEARALVDELMTQVRELSLDLRPAMLDDLGLLPALLWHIERYTARTTVQVTFRHSGLEGRFRPEVETAAYRIVQEALSNVARHAGGREATVRLGADAEMLRIQVEDRGVGFDAEAVMSAGVTSGLAGMRERAVLVGGQLTVESRPGTGTQVMAELPLTASPQAERRRRPRRRGAHDDYRAGR